MKKIKIKKYTNVLVALDLSSESYLPLERAIMIKEYFKASLSVIHIVNLPSPYISHAFISNIQEIMYEEGKKNLSNLCEQYQIPPEDQHVSIGSPMLNIIEYAKKSNINLIIVGSHSDYHLLPASLGSTATSLLSKINCDLLTVSIHPN